MNEITGLEEKIGYQFKNKQLLETALTHSSYANERHSPACQSYERLEFLGDSILGIVTADFLYHHEPELPEGRMTRLRAELVCETSLHKVALELGISEYMRLGRGEEHTGGRQRPSILADMVEAIIAAMYIDSGMDQAREFIMTRVLKDARIARRIIRPSFRSLCSAAAISISAMSLSARAAPTTARPLRFRSASTGFQSARAAAERRRKPSSRPPAERWRR